MLAWIMAGAVLLVGAPGQPAPPLTVSAAVSLGDALEAIATAYRAAGGGPVRFNLAGSNVLARQIANGAPADLFISADPAQMDVAVKAGGIDASTRVDLVANRLAVVTPQTGLHVATSGVRRVTSAADLASPEIRRIAIGDPDAVPAGVYARAYLQAAGLWEAIRPRLVPTTNVRAALSAVASGTVDAAVVYESDAAVSKQVVVACVIGGPDAPRIVYPAAVVAASRHRDAALTFLAFLQGPEAATVFTRFKLIPLGGRR